MASSSTSESDSLSVSSACKAQRWYESQSRRLNNEVEKIFPCFARMDRRYAPLCTAFRSASPNTKLLPTALHSISTPLQHSQIRPCCMQTQTATNSTISKNVRQFSSWLRPLAKKLCTALVAIYSAPNKESTFSEILISAVKSTFPHSNHHKSIKELFWISFLKICFPHI